MNTLLKQILLIAILGWSVCAASAQRLTPIGIAVTQMPRVALTNASGGGGITYIWNQDFEAGTGTISGWGTGGAVMYNSTVSPLAGSYSCRVGDGSNAGQFIPLNTVALAASEVYGKMLFRINTSLPSPAETIISVQDPGGTPLLQIKVLTTGQLYIDFGSGDATTANSISAGTVYYVGFHYLKGTGANSVNSVWFNTSDSNPGGGNEAISTNGSSTTQVDHISYQVITDATKICDFDNVQLSAQILW